MINVKMKLKDMDGDYIVYKLGRDENGDHVWVWDNWYYEKFVPKNIPELRLGFWRRLKRALCPLGEIIHLPFNKRDLDKLRFDQ